MSEQPPSTAAQAVLDATGTTRGIAAAAIRAAVDRAVPEPPNCGTPASDYVRGLEDRQRMVRFRLLSIADELDPPNA